MDEGSDLLFLHGGLAWWGMMTGCAAVTGLSRHDERVRVTAAIGGGEWDKEIEILVLRHQVGVLERQLATPGRGSFAVIGCSRPLRCTGCRVTGWADSGCWSGRRCCCAGTAMS